MEAVSYKQATGYSQHLFEVCATFRFSLFLKLDVKLLTLANQMKTAKAIRELPVLQYMLIWN